MRVEIRRIGLTDIYLDVRPIEREFRRMIDRKLIPKAKGYFKRIVEPWSAKNTPKIVARKNYTKDKLSVHIGPATRGRGTKIWAWLTHGTGPRSIKPRRAPVLRFQTGYSPRTSPGGSGRYRGPGKKFGPYRSAKIVKNHRIRPRLFEVAIARWIEQPFDRMYTDAIKKGVAKSVKGRRA